MFAVSLSLGARSLSAYARGMVFGSSNARAPPPESAKSASTTSSSTLFRPGNFTITLFAASVASASRKPIATALATAGWIRSSSPRITRASSTG
jgi:hypothetical protein